MIAHSAVQHVLCCVFVLFFFVLCTLSYPFHWTLHFVLPFRYFLPFQNAKFIPVFDGAVFLLCICLFVLIVLFIIFAFLFYLFCHIVCLSVLFYDLFILAFVSTIHRLHINRVYNDVSSNPAQGEVYLIQHLVIKFVSELW